MTDRPKLSLYVRNFSDHAGTDWNTTLETVRVMDAVGVDRVVVSDHVVFGRTCPPTPTRRWAERSAASSRRDRTASGWSR